MSKPKQRAFATRRVTLADLLREAKAAGYTPKQITFEMPDELPIVAFSRGGTVFTLSDRDAIGAIDLPDGEDYAPQSRA